MQTNNSPSKSRTNNASKSNNSNDAVKEPSQPRRYLADLFQPPADPVKAEAERDERLGHPPFNTNTKGSLSK